MTSLVSAYYLFIYACMFCQCRGTIAAMTGFLESFQKLSDYAIGSRGTFSLLNRIENSLLTYYLYSEVVACQLDN